MRIASCIAVMLVALGSGAGAQQLPNIRPLGAVVATAKDSVGPAIGVRALPGGRALVNDPSKRQVALLDSTLGVSAVVADSTSATANAYGGRVGGLLAWRGDTTLFIDPQSLSMLAIDPAGKLGRTMSVPRAEDAFGLTGLGGGSAALDPAGRILYRSFPRPTLPARGPDGRIAGPPSFPDSAAVVRVDLATRKLDTVGFVRTPKVSLSMTQDGEGRVRITTKINPLQVVDDWAVLPDGTIALVRGNDFHVDWVAPDGTRRSSAKVPFEWQRLTDENKAAFIDSVKAARERLLASGGGGGGLAGVAAAAGFGPVVFAQSGPPGGGRGNGGGGGGDGGAQGGRARPTPDGGPPTTVRTGAVAAAAGAAGGNGPQIEFVDPSELPDYKPPFFAGSLRVDPDGNLWIRTIPTRQIPGGPVYDVLNAKGELVDRVQVPLNASIAAFGPEGRVYLVVQERPGTKGVLEVARVR